MTPVKFASPIAARKAGRVHWPDVARGVGIVLVVLGHTIAGLLNAGVMEHSAGPHWVYYAIYTFHMPLFFVLSGIFLADGAKRGAEDFWTGKAWTIIYPYVLWSLTQGALQMWINGALGQPWTFKALASIGWQPLSQFWFLYALLLCHAAGMAFKDRPYVLLGVSLIGWVAASFMPWTWIAAKTLHFLPYYAAGMILSTRALRWRAPPVWVTLALMAAFGVSVAACHALEEWKAEALVVTPAALLGVAATFAVALSAEDAFGAALRWLGRASMTIFVLHILALAGVRMALSAMGVDDPILHLIAGVTLGLLGPAFTHVLLERWGLLPLFGFARPPRRAPVPVTSA
ncbi:MAG TPA: acyltransferase [Caulobacterales bacterium]|nr:acyltransferase [Caulobacterales bacterium]